MERKLVLHEAIHVPQNGDVVIELTDIQLHTNSRVTQSHAKAIERSIESQKPGRIFHPITQTSLKVFDSGEEVFSTPLFDMSQLEEFVKNYTNQGKRVFLKKPQQPLPMLPGKDTIDFLNSLTYRRMLRRLNK